VASQNGTWSESATGQSANGTISASSTETFSLYRSGTHSNGNWRFASLALSFEASGDAIAMEAGSNANFTSYEREDAYSYEYDLSAVGSGGVGTYTEDALETASYAFDGNLVGGGEVHDSSLVTVAFSDSGTVSLASGDLALGGVQTIAPIFPALPPLIDGLDVGRDGGAPAAPNLGGNAGAPALGGGNPGGGGADNVGGGEGGGDAPGKGGGQQGGNGKQSGGGGQDGGGRDSGGGGMAGAGGTRPPT